MAPRRGGLNKAKGLESLIPQRRPAATAEDRTEQKPDITVVDAEEEKTENQAETLTEKPKDRAKTAVKQTKGTAKAGGTSSKVKTTAKKTEKKSAETAETRQKIVEKPVEQTLRISQLVPNKEQPRHDFEEESLQELAESIQQHGMIQPILVMKKGRYYEIIAGERRWRAAQLAGLKKVPVTIREYSDQERMEISLIENIQREDLNAIEEALAFQKLIDEYQLKQEDLAKRISRSRAAVANSLRLLKLSKEVQEMLKDGKISQGHARALLALPDPGLQLPYAQMIVERGLSVRETEKLVKKPIAVPKREKVQTDPQLDAIMKDLEERLKQSLGTKVTIHTKNSGKGSIEIEYYSADEMERLLALLQSAGE